MLTIFLHRTYQMHNICTDSSFTCSADLVSTKLDEGANRCTQSFHRANASNLILAICISSVWMFNLVTWIVLLCRLHTMYSLLCFKDIGLQLRLFFHLVKLFNFLSFKKLHNICQAEVWSAVGFFIKISNHTSFYKCIYVTW